MKKKLSITIAIFTALQTLLAQSDWERSVGVMDYLYCFFGPSSEMIAKANKFVPRDAWREIEGKKIYAKGPGWWVISNDEVVAVYPNGVMIDKKRTHSDTDLFFISNFPDNLAQGERLKEWTYTAREAGTISLESIGGVRTLRNFEYGKPCDPPEQVKLTPAQIAAQKELKEKQRKASQASALKYNQTQADKGDELGQLRMGERYRDGDGVAKDAVMARKYFSLSAAQGNSAAAAELEKLNSPK